MGSVVVLVVVGVVIGVVVEVVLVHGLLIVPPPAVHWYEQDVPLFESNVAAETHLDLPASDSLTFPCSFICHGIYRACECERVRELLFG